MSEIFYESPSRKSALFPAFSSQRNTKAASFAEVGKSHQSKIRLFLIEELGLVREAISIFVNNQTDFEIIGQSGYEVNLPDTICQMAPDVILFSINEPNTEALHLLKRLKDDCPNSRVLAFGTMENPVWVRQLITAGTRGYVHLGASPSDLFNSINHIMTGRLAVDERIASQLLDRFLADDVIDPGRVALTPREQEVLKQIAWGYTGAQIAKEMGVSKHTVDTHRTRSMSKLGLKDRSEIIRYAVLQGWLDDKSLGNFDQGNEQR